MTEPQRTCRLCGGPKLPKKRYCATCANERRLEQARRYKAAIVDRETYLANKRERERVRRYGITNEQFDAMLGAQLGLCAVCGNPPIRKHSWAGREPKLHVDHDHISGDVRALLCQDCNHMLGSSGERSAVLRAAADYVDLWDAKRGIRHEHGALRA